MRWFKHITSSWEDERLASATAEYGLEIYGFWWRLLEIIGRQMDKTPKVSCQYSAKVWGKFAGISAKNSRNLPEFWRKKLIILKMSKTRSTYQYLTW